MRQGGNPKYQAKERITSFAVAFGIALFVGIWFFLGVYVGEGHWFMGLVGFVVGAYSGFMAFGRITDDVDILMEVPTKTHHAPSYQTERPLPQVTAEESPSISEAADEREPETYEPPAESDEARRMRNREQAIKDYWESKNRKRFS